MEQPNSDRPGTCAAGGKLRVDSRMFLPPVAKAAESRGSAASAGGTRTSMRWYADGASRVPDGMMPGAHGNGHEQLNGLSYPVGWQASYWWWAGAGVCFLVVVVATIAWGFWAGNLTTQLSVAAFVAAGVAGMIAGAIGAVAARRRIKRTRQATQNLVRMIRAAQDPSQDAYQYRNPELATCWRTAKCDNRACPIYGVEGQRCWQYQLDLHSGHPKACHRRRELGDCARCNVYRASRPDQATAEAEELNNMLYVVRREVERQKAAQEMMLQREKMAVVGQMAAGVAHEIGNPLASISALVQLLQRRSPGGLPADELGTILRHIDRISRIVRQMSDVTRPGSGDLETVSLTAVVEEATKLAWYDRRSHNIRLVHDDRCRHASVLGTRDELLQVLLNIIYNAFDAMPDGGVLTIEMAQANADVAISVADTGHGIAPEVLPHVFDPFYTTKQPGKGTGLGLALSAGIVHRRGGRIVIEPGELRGTKVQIRLPMDSARTCAEAQTAWR